LVGVSEAKSGGSRTLGFGEVREVFSLGDVDGDFTTFSVVFFILSAFILGELLDSKFLHGGVEKLGKTFGVEAVAINPNSFGHFCGRERCGWWFASGKRRVYVGGP
jgi:hypothetical protein